MQEDYFLKDTENNHWVEYFYVQMINHQEILRTQLAHGGIPAIDKSRYENSLLVILIF